jgi:enterochelin esterase-like enzyme
MFKYPEKRRRGFPLLRWSLVLALMFSSSCGRKPPPAAFPDTIPTTAQLAASRLHPFATRLKAMPEDQRGAAARQFLLDNPVSPLIEGDNLAGIAWYGRAQRVSINGDLQRAWTRPEPLEAIACGDHTFFYCLHRAEPDARLDYLLNVDGRDTPDPRNPQVTPSGFGPHSEITMPAFRPNPARRFREDIAHGSLDSLSFTNRNAPRLPRPLKVYRPAADDGSARLPVLYVYDGLEALNFMDYTNVLDNLIAEGKIQPVLVVFIGMLPEDGQLIPDKLMTLANMVCDEIVPMIDDAYPTARAPSRRAVAGISAWGNLALTTAFSRPEVFRLAAGQSTTVTDSLRKTLRQAAGKTPNLPAFRIYLDVGSYDLITGAMDNLTFLQANQRLRQELERRGISCSFQVVNDGHQWANWRERTGDILRFFFPAAPP